MSPEGTEREATASLTALNIPIKKKGKRRRKTPLYFRKGKSKRIKQGKPQISTKIPIEIEYSPTQRDKIPSPKSRITYVRRPNAISTSSMCKEIL